MTTWVCACGEAFDDSTEWADHMAGCDTVQAF
jgi:hypothetical protein